jgi:O-succinylbenzoic acid--CoA ligase
VVDERIQVRGPTLLDGYLDGPAPIDAAGWLSTGDRGRLDDAGRLHVLGREGDVIVSGGAKVDPTEVEAALEAHPAVAAACVFGSPDETWGMIVTAAIVSRPRRAPPALGELRPFLEARLAPYKLPRRLVTVEAIPLTPSGKPDRRALTR